MSDLKIFDLSALSTTGTAPTSTNTAIDMEIRMRKNTANTLRTTRKAERKDFGRQSSVNARTAAQSARQYDFRRGGYRR